MLYVFLLFISFLVATSPKTEKNSGGNTQKAQADSLYTIADTYYEQGQIIQAIATLQKALPVYEHIGDSTQKSDVLNDIGFFYLSLGS